MESFEELLSGKPGKLLNKMHTENCVQTIKVWKIEVSNRKTIKLARS